MMNAYKAKAPAREAKRSSRSKSAYRPKSKEKSKPEKEKAPARKKSNTDVEAEKGIDVSEILNILRSIGRIHRFGWFTSQEEGRRR